MMDLLIRPLDWSKVPTGDAATAGCSCGGSCSGGCGGGCSGGCGGGHAANDVPGIFGGLGRSASASGVMGVAETPRVQSDPNQGLGGRPLGSSEINIPTDLAGPHLEDPRPTRRRRAPDLKALIRQAYLGEGLEGFKKIASQLPKRGRPSSAKVSQPTTDQSSTSTGRPTTGESLPTVDVPDSICRSIPGSGLSFTGPADQLKLGEVCGIDLGPCPTLAGLFPNGLYRELSEQDSLRLEVQGPVVTKEEVWELLLPDYWSEIEQCGLSASEARAIVNTSSFAEGYEGLFFTRLFESCGALVVRTLYAHADFISSVGPGINPTGPGFFSDKCKSSYPFDKRKLGSIYREGMKKKGWTMKLFGDTLCGVNERAGVYGWPTISIGIARWSSYDVVASRAWIGETTAYTPNTAAYICAGYAAEICLADYYMWWAWRLLDLVVRGASDTPLEDLTLAQLCARCALAEINNLTGLLVHEWSHRTGSWKECGSDQVCCHNMLEWYFRHLMAAEYGLPVSHLAGTSRQELAWPWSPVSGAATWRVTSSSNWPGCMGRFDVTDGWIHGYYGQNCPQTGPGSSFLPDLPISTYNGNSFALATHSSLLELRHRVSIQYAYLPQCDTQQVVSPAGFVTGVTIYNSPNQRSDDEVKEDGLLSAHLMDGWVGCRAFCEGLYSWDAEGLVRCLNACDERYLPPIAPASPESEDWIWP